MESLDLTPHRLAIGDRVLLVEKLNAMQADLEAYSTQLNALAEEIRTARDAVATAAEVVAGDVFDDEQVSALTGWTSLKLDTVLATQAQQITQAAELAQSASSTARFIAYGVL